MNKDHLPKQLEQELLVAARKAVHRQLGEAIAWTSKGFVFAVLSEESGIPRRNFKINKLNLAGARQALKVLSEIVDDAKSGGQRGSREVGLNDTFEDEHWDVFHE